MVVPTYPLKVAATRPAGVDVLHANQAPAPATTLKPTSTVKRAVYEV